MSATFFYLAFTALMLGVGLVSIFRSNAIVMEVAALFAVASTIGFIAVVCLVLS